ncbi:MAG: hypothetical protein ACR2OO_03850 [Thermomicrobiales bacterium]
MGQRHSLTPLRSRGSLPPLPWVERPAVGSETPRTIIPIRRRIPSFPSFRPLEISDQFEIEQWVKQFPPYSDFNFVSLWC